MSVKAALDKIVERHQDVIGAMVSADGQVHHNFDAPYDVISVNLVLEALIEMFDQTSILEDEGYDFGETIIDFSNHSLIVRTIEGGLLAILAPSLQRGQLIKLHVGLGIFAKSVQKAVAEELAATPVVAPVEPTNDTLAAEPQDAPVKNHPPVVLSNPHAEAIDPHVAPSGEADESSLGRAFKRKVGGFRRSKEMLANRLNSAPAATSEPVMKEPEPSVNADGVPLNPDGTPKKKKIYRGQVYYE